MGSDRLGQAGHSGAGLRVPLPGRRPPAGVLRSAQPRSGCRRAPWVSGMACPSTQPSPALLTRCTGPAAPPAPPTAMAVTASAWRRCPPSFPRPRPQRAEGPRQPSASRSALQYAGPVSEGCFCPEGMTLFSTSVDICVPTGCHSTSPRPGLGLVGWAFYPSSCTAAPQGFLSRWGPRPCPEGQGLWLPSSDLGLCSSRLPGAPRGACGGECGSRGRGLLPAPEARGRTREGRSCSSRTGEAPTCRGPEAGHARLLLGPPAAPLGHSEDRGQSRAQLPPTSLGPLGLGHHPRFRFSCVPCPPRLPLGYAGDRGLGLTRASFAAWPHGQHRLPGVHL